MPVSTLSKGYKKPSNPTTGDLWFPALEDDIQLMNDHVHDGDTGAITPAVAQAISSGSWVAVAGGDGMYTQTITMPTGRTFDAADISFRLSTGEFVYPSVTRVSNSQYSITTNDNSKSYIAIYG